jgi:K+-transporting ATPase ATPase C chain
MIRRQLLAAVRLLVVLTVVLGVLYPLAVTAVAQLAMPGKADGSLIQSGGEVVGSSLIGQEFVGREWFHGRPDPFDGAASGPTNLGPSNPLLAYAVERAREAVVAADTPAGPIPADAVAGSGSGLDPDISPEYAQLQTPRVAAARNLSEQQAQRLVKSCTSERTLGILGEPRVNLLCLNLGLVALQP